MKNTVSIALDPETLTTLCPATGVHCGDDGGDGFCGTVASGVHCGDDVDE